MGILVGFVGVFFVFLFSFIVEGGIFKLFCVREFVVGVVVLGRGFSICFFFGLNKLGRLLGWYWVF